MIYFKVRPVSPNGLPLWIKNRNGWRYFSFVFDLFLFNIYFTDWWIIIFVYLIILYWISIVVFKVMMLLHRVLYPILGWKGSWWVGGVGVLHWVFCNAHFKRNYIFMSAFFIIGLLNLGGVALSWLKPHQGYGYVLKGWAGVLYLIYSGRVWGFMTAEVRIYSYILMCRGGEVLLRRGAVRNCYNII